MKDTYLSDEELLDLMNQIETEELVQAPEYLAENVMNSILKKEQADNIIPYQVKVKEPDLSTLKRPPRNKKKELTAYSFKVILAAAASILILLTAPMPGNQDMQPDGQGIQPNIIQQFQQNLTNKTQYEKQESNKNDKPVSKALGRLNQRTSNIFSYLNQSTTKLISNQGGNNHDKEEK